MSGYEGQRPLTAEEERNPHASASRWRHQESSAFARHAVQGQAREPVQKGDTGALANFLNSNRIEPEGDPDSGGNYKPITLAAADIKMNGDEDAVEGTHEPMSDGREIVCGPLLNYRRMDEGRWYGSVLIVTKGGGKVQSHQPFLVIRPAGQGQQTGDGSYSNGGQESRVESHCLYSDPRNTFWAFDINVPISATETSFEYEIPEMRFQADHKPRVNNFFVPAATESMRIMFHSCNGFSVGTDEEAWSGPALWNDVVRKHSERPWHVMVGGGDQIYNDGIRVDGPLRPWTDIKSPKKRREYLFPEKLRAECDNYYLKNYLQWYNKAPFSAVNGKIAQINIWDDHDVSITIGDMIKP